MSPKTLKTLIVAQFLTLLANCATVSRPEPEVVLPLPVPPFPEEALIQAPTQTPVQIVPNKEAQAIVRQGRVDLEADQLVSDPSQWQLLISAWLCEAKLLKDQTEDKLMDSIDRPILNANKKALKNIENAQNRLKALSLEPLSCAGYEVDAIVQCLESIPAPYCDKNPHLQAQVQAVENLDKLLDFF